MGYFYSIWGSNVEVVKVDYDADDIETTDSSLAVKSIYTVTLLRQINGPSYTTASVIMVSGDAVNVEIAAPFQQSTPPLSGAFYISCPNADGNPFKTRDLGYGHWTEGIDFYAQLEIPHLQFMTYIRDTGKYSYADNGREFMIVFQDYHGDVPQCTIESSDSNPIEGNNVVLNAITSREYG